MRSALWLVCSLAEALCLVLLHTALVALFGWPLWSHVCACIQLLRTTSRLKMNGTTCQCFVVHRAGPGESLPHTTVRVPVQGRG